MITTVDNVAIKKDIQELERELSRSAYLVCKLEDLNSNLQHPHENWTCLCVPVTPTFRRRQGDDRRSMRSP